MCPLGAGLGVTRECAKFRRASSKLTCSLALSRRKVGAQTRNDYCCWVIPLGHCCEYGARINSADPPLARLPGIDEEAKPSRDATMSRSVPAKSASLKSWWCRSG
jgi:hypothetical protein